jgi:hypothetical protein
VVRHVFSKFASIFGLVGGILVLTAAASGWVGGFLWGTSHDSEFSFGNPQLRWLGIESGWLVFESVRAEAEVVTWMNGDGRLVDFHYWLEAARPVGVHTGWRPEVTKSQKLEPANAAPWAAGPSTTHFRTENGRYRDFYCAHVSAYWVGAALTGPFFFQILLIIIRRFPQGARGGKKDHGEQGS